MSNDGLGSNPQAGGFSLSAIAVGVSGVAGEEAPETGGDSAIAWEALGGLTDGQIITFTTDGTYDFGTKPNDPKPLLVWNADDGISAPNAVLGRKSVWDGTFYGEVSSTIVAPEVSQSVRLDHAINTGAILAQVEFNSAPNLYVHRRQYDDFEIDTAIVIRTRYQNLVGTLNIGDTVTGQTSGATGIIREFLDDKILYEYSGGNINTTMYDAVIDNRIRFDPYEVMTTPSATMDNNEGQGMLTDFNNKHYRMWGPTGAQNDTYLGQDTAGSFLSPKVAEENTSIDGAFYPNDWDNNLLQKPYTWITDEMAYQDNSSANSNDGILWWWEDGVKAWEAKRFNFRNEEALRDQPYTRVYQRQVSNGARPNSYTYMASLYVDDSWCRVVVSDLPDLNLSNETTDTYTVIPLPPTAWGSNEISVVAQGNVAGKYWFIIDATGSEVIKGQFV